MKSQGKMQSLPSKQPDLSTWPQNPQNQNSRSFLLTLPGEGTNKKKIVQELGIQESNQKDLSKMNGQRI